jgi:HEAT repeat protein
LLGALGDVRAFEPLLQRLGDEVSIVRAAASKALGKLGFGAEAQLLSEALQANTEAVKQLRARIAGGEERLWRPLLAALADSKADRAAVSRLLGALGDVRAVEPLLQRLGDGAKDVRAAACEALGALGDVRAVEPMLPLVEPEPGFGYGDIQTAACVALAKLGCERIWEKIPGMLKSQNEVARVAACEAMGILGGERAVRTLLRQLNREDSSVRAAACKALGRIGDARAVNAIIQLTLQEKHQEVLEAAQEALNRLLPAPQQGESS